MYLQFILFSGIFLLFFSILKFRKEKSDVLQREERQTATWYCIGVYANIW